VSLTSTWTLHTVTFSGDTSLAITNDTLGRLQVYIGLMAGSTAKSGTAGDSWNTGYGFTTNQINFFDSTDNIIRITGAQLEVGSTATPFERRPFGMELVLCQRYFCAFDARGLTLVGGSASDANGTLVHPVPLRASPTLTGPTINRVTNFAVLDYAGSYAFSAESSVSVNQSAIRYARVSGSTWALGTPLAVNPSSGSNTITASAEI
jgi:hypothetical protein